MYTYVCMCHSYFTYIYIYMYIYRCISTYVAVDKMIKHRSKSTAFFALLGLSKDSTGL